jgi:outer membrane protein FlgP
MKRNRWLFLLFAGVCLLAGCAGNYQTGSDSSSAPGSVLGLSQQEAGTDKVVTFEVTGKGLEPETSITKGEAIIMAERAAIMDGYRQFVEKINGVYVEAYMKAGYGTVNHDMIKTSVQSWLRGVEIVEIRKGNHGITEATMLLRINFTKKGMVWWPSGIGANVTPS